MLKKIAIYTDGSSLGNPGPGGWAAILRYKTNEKIISGGEEHTTNNRMELMAVIKAIETLKKPCDIELFSDSTYVLKGIDKWLENWIKKNFKNVKNVDLWKKFIDVSKNHKIHTHWIKGHSGYEENEICDKMAKEQALKRKNLC